MEFGLRDVIYIVTIVGTAIATFLSTKHSLKEMVRDKHEAMTDKINDLKIEIERLNGKFALQEQTITQFKQQVMDFLPAVLSMTKKRTDGPKK